MRFLKLPMDFQVDLGLPTSLAVLDNLCVPETF
jgi:hypothetical protein